MEGKLFRGEGVGNVQGEEGWEMSNGYCLNDKLSCGSMFAGKSVQVERISGVEGRNVQMPMQHYKSLCLAVMI